MTKLTVVNNIKKTQESDHKIGNFYRNGHGDIYILSNVNYTEVALMSIDGNRWSTPQQISKSGFVTPTEFNLISEGEPFTKIESVTITIN